MADKNDPNSTASADAEVDIVDFRTMRPEDEQPHLPLSPDLNDGETLPTERSADGSLMEPVGLGTDLASAESSPIKSEGSGEPAATAYLQSPSQAEGDGGSVVHAGTSPSTKDEDPSDDSVNEDEGEEARYLLPERPGSRAGFHDDGEDSENQDAISRFPQAVEDDQDQTTEAEEFVSDQLSASAQDDNLNITPALEHGIRDFANADFSIPTPVDTEAATTSSSETLGNPEEPITEDILSDLNDFNSRVKRPIARAPPKYLMDREPEEVLDEQRFSLMGAPTLESTEALVAGLVAQYNPGHIKIFNRGLEIYHQKAAVSWQKFQVELMRANALQADSQNLQQSLDRLKAQMSEEQKLNKRLNDETENLDEELQEAQDKLRAQEDANEAAHRAAEDMQDHLEADLKVAEARSRHFRQQSDRYLAALEAWKNQAETYKQHSTIVKSELQATMDKHQVQLKSYQEHLDRLHELEEWQKKKIAECEKEKETLNNRRPDCADVGTGITSPIRPKYKGVPLSPRRPGGAESLWTVPEMQTIIRTLRAQSETLAKENAQLQKTISECNKEGAQTTQPEKTDPDWTIEGRDGLIAQLREENFELAQEMESLKKQVKDKISNDAKAGTQPQKTRSTRTASRPSTFATKPANPKLARGSWPGTGTNEDHLRNQIRQRDGDIQLLAAGYDELETELKEAKQQAAEAWDSYQNLKRDYHSSPTQHETDADESNEIALLVEENTTLRKQLAASTNSNTTQQSTTANLDIAHTNLVRELADAKREVELIAGLNAEADARNHAQATALQHLRGEHGQLKARYAEVDVLKTAQAAELQRMGRKHEDLRARFSEFRRGTVDQTTELQRTRNERDRLKTACLKSDSSQLGQASELQRMRSQHERLKTRYADLDGRYCRQEAECSMMRDKLKAARAPRAAPSSAAVLVAKENEILQQQLEEVREELKEANALIEQLNGRLNHQAFPPPPTPRTTPRRQPLTLAAPRKTPVTTTTKPQRATYTNFAPPSPQPIGWGNAPECYPASYKPHYSSSTDGSDSGKGGETLVRFPSDGYEVGNMFETNPPRIADMDSRAFGNWSEGYDRRFAARTQYLEREFGIGSPDMGGRAGYGRESPTRVETRRVLTAGYERRY